MASQLLRAALPFAHVHGFTRAALVQASAAGATAAPLSDTALGALFGSRPEHALFEEWLQSGLEDMRGAMSTNLPETKHEVLKQVLARRLDFNMPLIPHLRPAFRSFTSLDLAERVPLVSSVPHLQPGPLLNHVAAVADEALVLAKDDARGPGWYARRAVIGSIYSLAESHQLRSTSPRDTSAHQLLSRLLDEASRAEQAVSEVELFGSYIARSAWGIVRSSGALI